MGGGVPEVRGALHLGRHRCQDVQCAEGLASSGQLSNNQTGDWMVVFVLLFKYLYTNLCVMNSIVNCE